MKLNVSVPFRVSVVYQVEVERLRLGDIKEALRRKDVGDWESDPQLYGQLEGSYEHAIEEVKLKDTWEPT